MSTLDLSLNDFVVIKLRKVGADVLNQYTIDFEDYVKSIGGKTDNLGLRKDYKEGELVRMQLSEVFERFKKCNFSCGGEIPFTITIEIKD